MGIGPTLSAWKAGVLPLNYTRIRRQLKLYYKVTSLSRPSKQLFKKIVNFLKFIIYSKEKRPKPYNSILTSSLFVSSASKKSFLVNPFIEAIILDGNVTNA